MVWTNFHGDCCLRTSAGDSLTLVGWRNCRGQGRSVSLVGEQPRSLSQPGTSCRWAWRMWLQCGLETHQLGCQGSEDQCSVCHPAPPWGCWPQKQAALGRVIQLAVQHSQLLEQRFPRRAALAEEIYLIFFFLWINTEPGFHWKGFLPVEFVLSCAFLQEWHCKRYLLLLSLKCLSRFAPSQPYRQAAYSYLKTQYTETRITAVQPTHSCLQDKHVHQWSPGGNEVFSFLFFFFFQMLYDEMEICKNHRKH